MDELLDLVRRMNMGIDVESLLQRFKQQRHVSPQKPPPAVQHGVFIRTLAGIGEFLCKEKPLGKASIIRLIKHHALPAVRCRPGGWMARTDQLIIWIEVFMRHAEELRREADGENVAPKSNTM